MEVKKFLDLEGVKTIYDTLSLQDYPNNETLIAVLNAIDATKADKSEIEGLQSSVPTLYINGNIPTTKTNSICSLSYINGNQSFDCWIQIKCQGTSSLSYPKKNFTIKLFEDEECSIKLTKVFKSWGAQSKFVLKANWIDLSHARNIVSARLWGKIRATRENLPELLKTSPNYGAIDGFPVKVFCNDIYWGRYTLNIPKDGWMTNMDSDNEQHCILMGENYVSGCFRQEAVIDETDWSDELHDEVPATIVTSFNNAINFVMSSTDEDFKANIGNHFDLDSLIDYYLFSYAICHLDGLGKNQLMLTYDGTHWMAGAYDMDSTFGLYWNGEQFVSVSYRMQEEYETGANGTSNLLYDRLKANFSEEIKARWLELRGSILTNRNVIDLCEAFRKECPDSLYEKDYSQWTGNGAFTAIPLQGENTIDQMIYYIVKRLKYVDGMINAGNSGESSTEQVLRQAYSPNGQSWTDTANVDFASGDYIEIKVDLTRCQNTNENIIGIGQNIGDWGTCSGYLLYYTSSKQSLEINAMSSSRGSYNRAQVSLYDNLNATIIRIDSNGVSVNGRNSIVFNEELNNNPIIEIGSQEGSVRSNAIYEYIKVVKA